MAKDIEVRKENTGRNARTPSIVDPFSEMDRMFDNFFGSPFGLWAPELSLPRKVMSQIKETDNAYLLMAELPGVPKEDIQINVNGNLLTVKAEHQEEQSETQSFRREYRSFNQSFALPSTVEPDKIEAHYENGLLEVMLPKADQAQLKKIEVQSGKGGFLNRLLGSKSDQGSAAQKSEKIKH